MKSERDYRTIPLVDRLEEQAKEVLAGRGISYDIVEHWNDVSKLISLARAVEESRHLMFGFYCDQQCASEPYGDKPCNCGQEGIAKALERLEEGA